MKKAIWLTGVSGVGKTTIAESISRTHSPCFVLDADVLRGNFWPELGMSDFDRATNVIRIAKLGKLILEQVSSGIVIIACIAPNYSVRTEALKLLSTAAATSLVHLHCNLETRITRDPKGLYKRAIDGEINNLTGYDGLYEIPISADLTIDTGKTSIVEIRQQIMELIYE